MLLIVVTVVFSTWVPEVHSQIDGSWSDWSAWSDCSVTCGVGTQTRDRSCTNPAPERGGAECYGDTEETQQCDSGVFCPVDGGWSDWSAWSDCSVTCGVGTQTRDRSCTNPAPEHGGAECYGDTEETQQCDSGVFCPVDGGWSDWSAWSDCSVTCGVGTQTRDRSCTNPAPEHGGAECYGDTEEIQQCDSGVFCPDTSASSSLSHVPGQGGQWGPWAAWSLCNTSPAACGTGTHVRHRECQGMVCHPEMRGQWEQIGTFEDGTCEKPCEADNGGRGAYYNGNWGEWSNWECTEPCRPGVQARRERYCDDPAPTPGHHCIGDEQGTDRQEEPAACEEYCEKEWTDWSSWSTCSMTCDAPVRKRIRDCLGIGSPCPGEAEEVKDCDQEWRHDPCPPQHGQWGWWGPWSPDCYPQCKEGLHTRHRDCDNPPPVGDGEYCEGEDEDTKQCEVAEYMMEQCESVAEWTVAEWTNWGDWQQCTATCGMATGFRIRQCKNEDGTLSNTCHGTDREEAECSLPPCSLLEVQGNPTAEQLKQQALANLIVQEENKIHYNIIVETVTDAKLPCRRDKTQLAAESAEWKKDGMSLEVDGKHLVLDKWDLTIKSSEVEDRGIYVCRRGTEEDPDNAPIIYAVTVIPREGKGGKTVKTKTQISLPCNAGVLAILIEGATAQWKRDDNVVKNMENLGSLVIPELSLEDSGVYTCDVKDPQKGRHYTTNRVQLNVVKANMMDQALGKAQEIKLKNPAIYVALCGFGGYIVLVGIVCLIMKRIRARELKQEEELTSDEEEKIGMLGAESDEGEGEEGLVDGAVTAGGVTEAAPEEEKGSENEEPGSDENEEEQGSDNDQDTEQKGDGDDDDKSEEEGSEEEGSNDGKGKDEGKGDDRGGKNEDTGAESDDEGGSSEDD
ncbi:SCO-spondin-like isoform X3 [Branchiostoma floridae x Branchiostoma japonicum]